MPAGIVVKPANEERFSTTTPAADADLSIPMSAGGTYLIRGRVFLSAHETPGLRVGLSVGGASISYAAGVCETQDATSFALSVDNHIDNTSDQSGAFTSANLTAGTTRATAGGGGASYMGRYLPYWFTLLIEVGETGGNFTVLWSQSTSDATWPAVMRAGSSIQWERVDHEGTKTAWVFKAADETRYRSEYASLTDDLELSLPLEANKAYWICAIDLCYVQRQYAARHRVGLNLTSAATFYRVEANNSPSRATASWGGNQLLSSLLNGPGLLGVDEMSIYDATGSASTAARGIAHFNGRIDVGGTPGDLRLQWRTTDNGGSNRYSTVHAGSWLLARELNPCVIP